VAGGEMGACLAQRVENLVGLRVTEVNITVNDVLYPESQEQDQQG